MVSEPADVLGQAFVEAAVDGEPVFGKLDGRLEHLREAHRAKAGDRRGPGVHDRGDTGRQVAVAGYEVDPVLTAPVDGERFRRPAHTADGECFSLPGRVDQRGRLAANTIALRLEHIEAEAHRRRRIDGVAALLHDAEARGGGQVVPGRDDAAGAHDYRTCCEPRHSSASVPSGMGPLTDDQRPTSRHFAPAPSRTPHMSCSHWSPSSAKRR